jgi:uncharacterized small protein (DUF1192 family)
MTDRKRNRTENGTDRLQEIRVVLDAGGPVFGADVRWLLAEVDALRERVAVLRAEIADLEGLRA